MQRDTGAPGGACDIRARVRQLHALLGRSILSDAAAATLNCFRSSRCSVIVHKTDSSYFGKKSSVSNSTPMSPISFSSASVLRVE